jgi:formate dehydrogenase alpha subunit
MTPTVRLRIDGQEVSVPAGLSVLTAAHAVGIEIPHLCYHPALSPAGICRLCLVEVDGKLTPACRERVREGMAVDTCSARVRRLRRLILELILSDHPLDCLTCDQNGACDLQRYAYAYGIEANRFRGPDHERRSAPPREDNPFIRYEPEKCILCGRCVRVCAEVQGRHVLGFAGRGFRTQVTPPLGRSLTETNCEFCGQCLAVCPTGALAPKGRRFAGREWELRMVHTVCPFCGCGCPITLHLTRDRIVKVSGGFEGFRLCVKGRFGLGFVHREDRLKTPLLRHHGELREASWDEALARVVSELIRIKNCYGPDAIAGLASAKCTNEENYLFQKFLRAAVGTNNIDHCARLCHAPSVAGLAQAFGSGAMTNSIAEIEDSDCILVTGSNTTEAHPIVAQAIVRAVRKGAKLIVVDPREIELADIAHLHLRPRPGTDVAWLNGLAHVILAEDLWNKKFVAERCEGFEEFREAVVEYTPERVEEITGIPAALLREAARAYARAQRGTIIYAMGITQHTTGTDNVLALANLALLTGHIGRPASGVNPLRGQNNVQGACDMGCLPGVFPGYQPVTDPAVQEKFAAAWGVALPKRPGLTAVEMIDAARAGTIRAMIIMGENPMVSHPDLRHVAEALSALEFLVVLDIFPTETTEFAHVVLPAASFAEKDGTFTNTERRVQRVRKALSPPGEARADWEILAELSTRMGYPMTYRHPAEIMAEIAALTPIYGGISYPRLEGAGLQWPCPTPDHPGTPFLHAGKFTRGKGKFHAVAYRGPAELPDPQYPLTLTTGRVLYQYHTRTMTGRVAGLEELVPEAYIEIHPTDAAALGIADGERVRVSSRRGAIELRAQVTDRVPPGTVFIPFHFAQAAANALIPAAPLDPAAKMPALKACAVRVDRIGSTPPHCRR